MPAIRSLDSDNLMQNEDGSYDVYMRPEAPEGFENNWVKTKEGVEINSESSGTCYGYELAICMQEVRNGTVQPEWCQ